MSIASGPYPRDGVEWCPSVFVAERVVFWCVCVHGRDTPLLAELCPDLKWEGEAGVEAMSPVFWGSGGIMRLRRRIAALWRAMGPTARGLFLQEQLADAEKYLADCRAALEGG